MRMMIKIRMMMIMILDVSLSGSTAIKMFSISKFLNLILKGGGAGSLIVNFSQMARIILLFSSTDFLKTLFTVFYNNASLMQSLPSNSNIKEY